MGGTGFVVCRAAGMICTRFFFCATRSQVHRLLAAHGLRSQFVVATTEHRLVYFTVAGMMCCCCCMAQHLLLFIFNTNSCAHFTEFSGKCVHTYIHTYLHTYVRTYVLIENAAVWLLHVSIIVVVYCLNHSRLK